MVIKPKRSPAKRRKFESLFRSLVESDKPRNLSAVIDNLLFLLCWVEGALAEEEESEESMMLEERLGSAFMEIGSPKYAIFHFKRALDLHEAHLGPSPVLQVVCYLFVGLCLLSHSSTTHDTIQE